MHQIDDYMKKQFEQQVIPFEESHWLKAEALLAADEKRKRRKFFTLWFRGLGALVVLVVAGLCFYNQVGFDSPKSSRSVAIGAQSNASPTIISNDAATNSIEVASITKTSVSLQNIAANSALLSTKNEGKVSLNTTATSAASKKNAVVSGVEIGSTTATLDLKKTPSNGIVPLQSFDALSNLETVSANSKSPDLNNTVAATVNPKPILPVPAVAKNDINLSELQRRDAFLKTEALPLLENEALVLPVALQFVKGKQYSSDFLGTGYFCIGLNTMLYNGKTDQRLSELLVRKNTKLGSHWWLQSGVSGGWANMKSLSPAAVEQAQYGFGRTVNRWDLAPQQMFLAGGHIGLQYGTGKFNVAAGLGVDAVVGLQTELRAFDFEGKAMRTVKGWTKVDKAEKFSAPLYFEISWQANARTSFGLRGKWVNTPTAPFGLDNRLAIGLGLQYAW